MKFMMLMIPAVYQGGAKVDAGFKPDPKKMEPMGKFNEEMGKAVKIISLNGLHPLSTGARVAFGYVMNAVKPRWQNPRNRALIDALYRCL